MVEFNVWVVDKIIEYFEEHIQDKKLVDFENYTIDLAIIITFEPNHVLWTFQMPTRRYRENLYWTCRSTNVELANNKTYCIN
jgi:hypothetical protein